MLLVLYQGDIKHFIRKAKNKPYYWDVKWKPFDTTKDEYLENKVKYLMEDGGNMDMRNYEEIIYDFYPDRKRIDSFFDRHRNMYDYKLYEMGRNLRKRFWKIETAEQVSRRHILASGIFLLDECTISAE